MSTTTTVTNARTVSIIENICIVFIGLVISLPLFAGAFVQRHFSVYYAFTFVIVGPVLPVGWLENCRWRDQAYSVGFAVVFVFSVGFYMQLAWSGL